MSPPSLWVRRLCIAIVAVSIVEFVIATPGVQIRHLPHSTDFATYYLAGAMARDGLSPYDRDAIAARGRDLGFTHDQFPFLYPPPFALAMQPLARLAYPRARQIWMVVSTLALLGGLALSLRLVWRMAACAGIAGAGELWIVAAAFSASALNSTSVHNDIRAGSVGALLFLAAAGAACAMLRGAVRETGAHSMQGDEPAPRGARGADWAAAAAMAGATLCKLVPAVWIPWAAWRGRGRTAVWALVLLAAAMVPALVHWGAGIVPAYVRDALLPSLRDDVAPPMNQSLDAVLSRLFVSSRWVTSPFDAPLAARVLSVLATAAVVVVTARDLARRDRDPLFLPVEFGSLVLAMLLVMKLTWVQTLCVMLFVWPALMVVLLTAAERGLGWARPAIVAACAGYFLSSAHVPILWEGLRRGPAVAVTGVHALGLLMLWVVCGVVLRRAAALQGCAATAARGRRPAGIKL